MLHAGPQKNQSFSVSKTFVVSALELHNKTNNGSYKKTRTVFVVVVVLPRKR